MGGNRIQIGSRVYQFWKSREIEGKVKTVTVKRSPLGELFLVVVVDSVDEPIKCETGRSAGFDFGLHTFLVCSERQLLPDGDRQERTASGFNIQAPLFFKESLNEVRKANRQLSRKVKGSHHRERARIHLARQHEAIAQRRIDWFWKLAHQLTNQYDYLFFETLNLKGMQRLWGRKVSDLAFREFLSILEWVATQKGKAVVYIDCWYPSTKTCSGCGHVLGELDLSVRWWRCPSCQAANDRDHNAAKNICTVGASTVELGNVRQAEPAIAA